MWQGLNTQITNVYEVHLIERISVAYLGRTTLEESKEVTKLLKRDSSIHRHW